MNNTDNAYQLILELNKLKRVFRTTRTDQERRESTAEHSWSASMIVMVLMDELRKEFGEIDELKTIKLAMIHDIVEIYAGDVMAFNLEARKNKTAEELEALQKLMDVEPEFGKQLHALWHEFETRQTLEAKIAKAADSICPMFLRVSFGVSYIPINISLEQLEKTMFPKFEFSEVFKNLYGKLVKDLTQQGLITGKN